MPYHLTDKRIDQQKENLLQKMGALADKCARPYGKRMPTATWAKIISNFSCEKRISEIIENNRLANITEKFDPYYTAKSLFATAKILDHIKTSLSENKLEAFILTETPWDMGRYDAVIVSGNPSKAQYDNAERVRLEIKGSLGLDLEQIQRYLWDPIPIIVVRVMTRHVVKIDPLELQSYTLFSLEELNNKIDRLISNRSYIVPGNDCIDCLQDDCIYWRQRNRRTQKIVTLTDTEFTQDIALFLENIPYVSQRAAVLVIEQFRSFKKQELSVFPQA